MKIKTSDRIVTLPDPAVFSQGVPDAWRQRKKLRMKGKSA